MKTCASKRCNNKVKNGRVCSRCRHRKLKADNPLLYLFRMHRSNAKARKCSKHPKGIPFEVDLAEFSEVWTRDERIWTEKLACLMSKRKRKTRWELDRIKPELGYVSGNLRIITKRFNVLYRNHPELNTEEKEFRWMSVEEEEEKYAEVCPF